MSSVKECAENDNIMKHHGVSLSPPPSWPAWGDHHGLLPGIVFASLRRADSLVCKFANA
ncbi:MAG: hypothetical protein HY298_09705 [Verrucomicrobia bacterium]|nr:hypothetical protein [Verrucomicrobiota bacterium]